MAGETLREVLIRIRTEVADSKITPPDLKPLTQAAQAATQQIQASQQAAVQKTAAVTQQAAQQQVAAQKQVAAATKTSTDQILAGLKAQWEADTAALKANQEARSAKMRASNEALVQLAREVDAIRAQEKASVQMAAANLRAASAFRSVGESVMQTVRGYVLLNATNEEQARKVLNTLLVLEGSIALYKGLSGVLVGVARGYQALEAAAKAAAVAQAAAAVAGSAGTIGNMLASTGAFGAGLVGAARFAAPIAGVAGTIGAPLAVGAGIGHTIVKASGLDLSEDYRKRDASERSADRMEVNSKLNFDRRSADRMTAFSSQQRLGAGRLGLGESLAERGRDFDLSQSAFRSAEARGAMGDARTFSGRDAARAGMFAADASTRGVLAQQTAAIGGELAARQQLAAQANAKVDDLSDTRSNMSGTAGGLASARKAAAEAARNAEQGVLDAIQRQTQARERQLAAQQNSLQLTRQMLAAEKDRVGSTQQALGRLSEGEFAEIKRINDKVKAGGKLDEEELQTLERSGGFGQFTGEQREKIGAARAGENLEGVDALTGGGSQISKLQDQITKLIQGDAGGPGIEKLVEEIAASRKKEADQIEKLATESKALESITTTIEKMAERFNETDRELKRILQQLNRGPR